jgi:UDP-N-acetylmuramyl pentapeptide phosphotransferase/UDP-N-acetylglucosamine-1-phosphate transferase
VSYLPAIFSLLVAAAGWFHIFYSRAATNLSPIEQAETNRLRIRLRRIGGVVMILLAVSFYLGFAAIERHNAIPAIGLMLTVVVLMVVIVALGLVDLRLTKKLRERPTRKQDRS